MTVHASRGVIIRLLKGESSESGMLLARALSLRIWGACGRWSLHKLRLYVVPASGVPQSYTGTIFVSEMLNTFEETFEVTEMRTFKHEPFFIVGAEGVVSYPDPNVRNDDHRLQYDVIL